VSEANTAAEAKANLAKAKLKPNFTTNLPLCHKLSESNPHT
jgi:hypothetical protein